MTARLGPTCLALVALLALRRGVSQAQRPAPDVVPAAGGGITIAPVTHATLQIRQGATVILVDPARFTPGAPLPFTPQPGKLPELPPGITPRDPISTWPVTPGQLARFDGLAAPTIILVTDEHDDHLDPKAIEALRTPATIVVGPAVVGRARAGHDRDWPTARRGRLAASGSKPSRCTTSRPSQASPRSSTAKVAATATSSFWPGSGSTWPATPPARPEVKALRRIDVAFLPMNLPYTMSAADAAACARAFAPRIVYPYHSSGTDVAAFARALDGSGIEVRVRDWYAK